MTDSLVCVVGSGMLCQKEDLFITDTQFLTSFQLSMICKVSPYKDMNSKGYNGNSEGISHEDLEKFNDLMLASNVEIDKEALVVVANLLRLNVPPDEVYSVIKQIAPVCGLLKKFKLKSQKSMVTKG